MSSSELVFPAGLVGFAGPQRFSLERWGGDESPFSLLRSVDDDALAFVVVPPAVFFPDYEPEIDDDTAAVLDLTATSSAPGGAEAGADAIVLVIVTVPDLARNATANLLGPLVVNAETRVGVQAVLDPDRWPPRRPLVPTA